MPRFPNFVGESYPSEIDQERSVCDNWFLERQESEGAPTPWALLPTPGVLPFAHVPETPIRGLLAQGGRAWTVAGTVFYEVFADGTTLTRGTVAADPHPVTIHANGDAGDQLGITSGGIFYCYDKTTHALTAAGVGGTVATMGASIDGRFIYLDATTGTLYSSALYNGTTWDPTHYLQSTAGDPWVALCVTPDRLIRVFGETTGEVLVNQGLPGFPFAVVQEAFIPYGIQAPYAFTVDTSVTWLAQTAKGRGQIVRAQGYTPQRVSTHGIEHTIQRYTDVADATAWSYQRRGHPFALFTFPTPQATWVTDEATGKWHSRSYWNPAAGTAEAYRPGCAMHAFGLTLVGDRRAGTIYQLTPDSSTDVDGALIRHTRQPAPLAIDRRRFVVDAFEVVADVGVGLVTGQGSDPQAMLRLSRDGGKTFGVEHWTSLGPLGQYQTRVRWTQLGNGRSFVPQLVVTDPVPTRITDASITLRAEA